MFALTNLALLKFIARIE